MKKCGVITGLAMLLLASPAIFAQTPTNADSSKPAASAKAEGTPAEFPGGLDAWLQYLEKNLKYPKKAFRKNIQGMVRVQFVVDKDGTVKEVVALNDPGGGLAEEAVRIIAEGPNWIPAEKNGKKVIYRHIQSITFRLE